ncbi:Odorant-binding protein 58b [Drosophila erecta]|uniref:Odorant-binding protein 58b n=2 Tax=Drosophila erecta TaxID=7220 RepID=B3NNU6_DROER|nr:Odorant-binding protein 58b [Drosophila erecta]
MLRTGFVICVILSLLWEGLLAIRVHCRHTERIHEENIHHCCQHPDGHNDVTEMCAKQTNFRLPNPEEEAIEDVTVDQAMLGTCWAKCVFDHYNLMENNTLDMVKVRTHYKRYHQTDPEYETEMLNAYEKCHSQSEDATEQFLSLPIIRAFSTAKFCKPVSSIIMSCVIYNFFHNCPKNRWSNTTECVETLAFAKKCKDVLTTM